MRHKISDAPRISNTNEKNTHLTSSDETGNCLSIKKIEGTLLQPIVIENSNIGPCKNSGIVIEESSYITIKNNYIHDTGFINLSVKESNHISIINNQMSNGVTGISIRDSSSISIKKNRVLNPVGPVPSGQFVVFVNVSGEGNEVFCNLLQNQPDPSRVPEDGINIFQSSGVADSIDPLKKDKYIKVKGNKIFGGGSSPTGGGILLGDWAKSSYIDAFDNILVNPGQYGMAIVGGETFNVYYNLIYSSVASTNNIGLYVWNYYGGGRIDSTFFPECRNMSVFANTIEYYKFSDANHTAAGLSTKWDSQTCGTLNEGGGNISGQGLLAPSIINNVIDSCVQ